MELLNYYDIILILLLLFVFLYYYIIIIHILLLYHYYYIIMFSLINYCHLIKNRINFNELRKLEYNNLILNSFGFNTINPYEFWTNVCSFSRLNLFRNSRQSNTPSPGSRQCRLFSFLLSTPASMRRSSRRSRSRSRFEKCILRNKEKYLFEKNLR